MVIILKWKWCWSVKYDVKARTRNDIFSENHTLICSSCSLSKRKNAWYRTHIEKQTRYKFTYTIPTSW